MQAPGAAETVGGVGHCEEGAEPARRVRATPAPAAAGSDGLVVAAGLRSLLGLRVTLGILGDGDLRSFRPRLERGERHHSYAPTRMNKEPPANLM
jgi:hypothetical protein